MFCIRLLQKCAADVWLHASDVFGILLSFSQAYYQCRCLNLFRFRSACMYLGNSLRTYSPALRPSSLHLQKRSNHASLCVWCRAYLEQCEQSAEKSREDHQGLVFLPSRTSHWSVACPQSPHQWTHLPAGPRKKGVPQQTQGPMGPVTAIFPKSLLSLFK